MNAMFQLNPNVYQMDAIDLEHLQMPFDSKPYPLWKAKAIILNSINDHLLRSSNYY